MQRSAADAAAGPSALERPDSLSPIGDSILPDGIIRNTFAIGEDIHPAECLRNIQEMFQGKLDADVIHMVLVECEYNVNNALEALFTLLPPETGVERPAQPSNMSTSSESLAAGENIVTSEAEVHKSSEDSERESLLGLDTCAAASASSSDLALFVDAPPFVPSQPSDKPCLEALETPRANPSLAWSKLLGSGSELGFNITPPPGRSKSAALSASAKEQQNIYDLVSRGQRVLVLMRGLPGSGKTTLALKMCGATGVILSADHFFYQDGRYSFDKARLSEAHEWNKRRAKQAMQEGHTPVIIDNTNVEVWEMMPYVALALRSKYHVCMLEPDTPWKFDARQLAQKNMHGVARRTIDSMLERYDRNVTSESLCESFGVSRNISGPFADSGLDVRERCTNNSSKTVEKTMPEPSAEQHPSTSSSSDKVSITALKETISLGDLMALVQNDSEESGSRSRQNSDSWSSGHDANDWEDVTERDDDFLWAARKCLSPSAQADSPLGGAIQEECDVSDQENSPSPTPDTSALKDDRESTVSAFQANAEPQPCTDEDTEQTTEEPKPVVAISGAEHELYNTEEGVLEVPKPPRGSPRHHVAPTWHGSTPVIETPADFTAPWESAEERNSGGTTGPKEQRSPQRCKKSSKGLCEDSPVPDMLREVSHTVPRVAESSRHNHFSARGPIFGLEKVVRSSTWTLPEFNLYEPIEPEQPADSGLQRVYASASSFTDPADSAVVRKVLLGESDEFAVVVASDFAAVAPDESAARLPPACKPNTLNRSTDTDDLPADDLDYAGRLSLLQQCMPTVKPPDLEDIFQHCHGDHIWAADLLLDTDVSCDLQPLVIKEECEGGDSSSSSATSGQREPGVPLALGTVSKEKLNSNKQVPRTEPEMQCVVKVPADARTGTRSTNQPQQNPVNADREFTLQLDHSFACQLVEAFGSEGLHVSLDAFRTADLSVTVTSELAKQLHQLWMDTLRQTMSKEEEEMLQMAADPREDEPQGLQSRGEGSSRENVPENGPIVPPPPPALNDDPRWNKPPSEMSFREIMEMEAALEEKRKDWTKSNAYMDMATKLKHKQLYDRFPGVDRQALDEIFVASNYSLIQSVSTINETLGMASDANSDENYEKQIVELVQMESMQPEEESEDMTWQPVVAGHEDMYDRLRLVGDYDVIRREATVHYHMRQESFRKAKEAYHRGMKTVAAFYSQQGRAYAEKMREANERASWKLLQLRNAQCDDNSLDLHGLHVQEAIQVLKNFVKLKKRESWCLQKKQTLRIITGRGAHSALNIPKVKFAVEGYLLSSQLNYREVQAGMFHVML